MKTDQYMFGNDWVEVNKGKATDMNMHEEIMSSY